MIIRLTNTIGAIGRRLGIVTKNLQMWLGFYKSEVIGKELMSNGVFNTDDTSSWSGYYDSFTFVTDHYNLQRTSSDARVRKVLTPSLVVGNTYVVEIEAKYVGAVQNIRVGVTDAGDNYNATLYALTNSYKKYTHTFVATSSTTHSLLWVTNGNSNADFKSYSIKEVSQFAPDKSTNSNDAKLFTGKALSFNGNDSVVLDGFTSSGDTFTFAFWAKETTSGATKMILDINPSRFIITYKNGVLNIYSGGYVAFKSMPINEFSRVIVAINGTSISVYINGEKYGDTKTLNSALNITNATVVRLGGEYTNLPQYYFNGLLSDFQIYNASWIQSDVAFDYNNPNHLVTDNPDTTLTLSNLSAYYALSEGSGSIAYDSSGGGNNGTITGATYDDQQPTIPQLGMMDWVKSTPVATEVTLIQAPNNKGYDILGNSLRLRERGFNLDGSGYAEVADDDSLDFGTGDFSIETWVKADYLSQGSSINSAFSLGEQLNGSDSSGVGVHGATSKFICYIGGSSLTSNNTYVIGIWYNILITRASGLCTMYVDATPQIDTETNTNSITSSSVKYVGRDSTTTRFYNNTIDEPRLYNRALTQKEITNNYKVGLNAHKVGSAFSTEFSSEFGF